MTRQQSIVLAKRLLGFGFFVLIAFTGIILYKETICFEYEIDMAKMGQYGDFIGGVVGSIWALAGVIYIYSTILQQNLIIDRESDRFLYDLLIKKFNNQNSRDVDYKRFKHITDSIDDFNNFNMPFDKTQLISDLQSNIGILASFESDLSFAIRQIGPIGNNLTREIVIHEIIQLLKIGQNKSGIIILNDFLIEFISSFKEGEGSLLYEGKPILQITIENSKENSLQCKRILALILELENLT